MRAVPEVEIVPFRHAVVDGWWDEELLAEVVAEFPDRDDPRWRRYQNARERKMEGPPSLWGDATRRLFSEMEERTPLLEAMFAIDGMHMETVGGGYHLIAPGGLLDIHTDFNRSPRTQRFRRLNLLVYLNAGWDDEGGQLEMWDESGCVKRVAPEWNRTVVFESSSSSWHGHPHPASRWRRSVAAYFFSDEPPAGFAGEQSTVWHPAR